MTAENKKEIISRLISILMFTVFLLGATFIWINASNKFIANAKANVYALSNSKSLKVVELTDGIKLLNAYPVNDEVGMKTNPYAFKIINESDKELKYAVYFLNNLDEVNKSKYQKLEHNFLRYTIKQNDSNYIPPRNLTLDGNIYVDTLKPFESVNYSFIFWLDQNAGNDAQNKYFNGKVYINVLKNDLAINK